MRFPVDAAATALIRLYEAAEAQLQALVADALASGALGTARYRQQRLAEVQQILAALNGTAIPEATGLVVESYQLGSRIAGLRGGFGTGVHREAVEILADALTGKLNDASETLGRRVEDTFRREGLRATAMHLIEGSTRREASARLAKALADQGVRAFEDRAGREWHLSSYAEMVVRTTTREAVTQGTVQTMLQSSQDLITISSHVHDEDVCSQFDGRTFSLTGATEGYPIAERLPPYHPRCRHVATPTAANLDALERELGLMAA